MSDSGYTPQILVKDGVERVANSVAQENQLVYDGYSLKGKDATNRNTSVAQREGGAPKAVTAEAKAALADTTPETAGTAGTKSA